MTWPLVIIGTLTHFAMYVFGRWCMRREILAMAYDFSTRERERAGRYSPTLIRFLGELEGRRSSR